MAAKLSRRHLFRLKPRDVAQLVRESEKKGGHEEHPVYFRPPGAVKSEREFLSACERCGKCVEACPHDVIEQLSVAAGEAEGSPVLNPAESPCRWCPTMDCIEACPTSALSFGRDREVAPIGKAVINLETCLTSHGTICDTCAQHCPGDVRAIRMINRVPELDSDRCVGCGLCAYYCESHPGSIRILHGDGTATAS